MVAGTSITSPIIRGGAYIVENPSAVYMSIIKAEPFGASNDLVEWYGAKIDGVTWDAVMMQPIYSGMSKANATTYKISTGSAYFGGTIIAGVLRNAVQTSTLTATPTVESGSFGSNGGDIFLTCSLSVGRRVLSEGTCPINPNPTGTIYLDRLVSGSWVNVASQVVSGTYECSQEGAEYIADWSLSGSFTYTDTLRTTSNRQYRLRAVHTLPVLPNGTLRLSLISQE